MSVSLWAWTKECDDKFCVGDCDLCHYIDEEEEESRQYIDKEETLKRIRKDYSNLNVSREWYMGMKFAMSRIVMQPAADVKKVVHGEWILSEIQNKEDNWNDNYGYICSNCKHLDVHSKTAKVPFCWYCGAEMRTNNAPLADDNSIYG